MPSPLGVRLARAGAAVWALMTAVLLLAPGSAFDRVTVWAGLEEALEIAAHFGLHLGLAGLVRVAFLPSRAGGRERAPWITALVLYCVGLEILQLQVPNRSVQLIDVVVGLAGIAFAFGLGRGAGAR